MAKSVKVLLASERLNTVRAGIVNSPRTPYSIGCIHLLRVAFAIEQSVRKRLSSFGLSIECER